MKIRTAVTSDVVVYANHDINVILNGGLLEEIEDLNFTVKKISFTESDGESEA